MTRRLDAATLALLALLGLTGPASGQVPSRLEPEATPSVSGSTEAVLSFLRRHVRVERQTEHLTSRLRVSYRQVGLKLPLPSRRPSAWKLSLGVALGVARLRSDDRRDRLPREAAAWRRSPFASPYASASLSLEYAPLPFCRIRARLIGRVETVNLPSGLAPARLTVRLDP